jgi:hypothetical protein
VAVLYGESGNAIVPDSSRISHGQGATGPRYVLHSCKLQLHPREPLEQDLSTISRPGTDKSIHESFIRDRGRHLEKL